jgi:hypothetical protein
MNVNEDGTVICPTCSFFANGIDHITMHLPEGQVIDIDYAATTTYHCEHDVEGTEGYIIVRFHCKNLHRWEQTLISRYKGCVSEVMHTLELPHNPDLWSVM